MTDRLTPEREAEIATRAEAATPGPWHTDGWEIYQGSEGDTPDLMKWIGETCRADDYDGSRADAAFIAHARTDVPALLAELAAVRAERDQARARVAELERPAIEAKRNEIRQSYAELIATCAETKDYEGAFDVECRLREREEQWKREDAATAPAEVAS